MITFRQLATVATTTTSFLLVQLIGSVNTPFSHRFSHRINWNFNSQVLAQDSIRYVPPVGDNPKRTQGTGSRGCKKSVPVSLTLLVPNHRVGLTTSSRPTFLWYVPDNQSVQMEFSLVEPGVPKPLFQKQTQVQKEGIVQLATPQNSPELAIGREYRWVVTLICNPKRRSEDVFAQGWIKRVPIPPLAQQLQAATSDRDRANIYAQAGLWYNALETIWTAATANPSDSSVQEARFSLLNQVGLTQVAARERQRLARQSN